MYVRFKNPSKPLIEVRSVSSFTLNLCGDRSELRCVNNSNGKIEVLMRDVPAEKAQKALDKICDAIQAGENYVDLTDDDSNTTLYAEH